MSYKGGALANVSNKVGGRKIIEGKEIRHFGIISVQKSSDEESGRKTDSQTLSIYKASDEYYEYSCDPCTTGGEHVKARGFCVNCVEYLCETCLQSHSRSKASKQHMLLNQDTMPKKAIKFCDVCKSDVDDIEATGYCKDCKMNLCGNCCKSHVRKAETMNHVLVDKDTMPDLLKYNEEYSLLREINVKAENDEKDCYITGMALVSDTELVLCDRDNNCLKLIDISTDKIKGVLVLKSKPNGITTISKEQVAVVLNQNYQIEIVFVSEGLSVTRTIKTTSFCVDVKLVNGKLFVSLWNPVQFQVLNLTGTIVQTIKPNSEVLRHCTLPRHIAVSNDGSTIYVSDWKTGKVLSIDRDGHMVSLYQGELVNPRDILLSPNRSIYVCSRDQHVVYKMTADLSEVMVLLGQGDGLAGPQAMCLNNNTQHIYISSGSEGPKYGNFIKVYHWK